MNNNKAIIRQQENQNPFIYNVPVRGEDFYNRQEVVEWILHETVSGKSQGNAWITGERQVGKTSLLRYIQSMLEKNQEKVQLYGTSDFFNVAFVYLNVQDDETSADFYKNLRQSLKNFFDFKIKSQVDPFKNFITVLKYFYSKQNYFIVFLVDEFDSFIENFARKDKEKATTFLAELNKMIQGVPDIPNSPKIFSCVFAANHTISELFNKTGIDRVGSGLILESTELPWFNREQVEELAVKYLHGNEIKFTKKEIDFCFKMTGGYPYFTQRLFHIMFKKKLQDGVERNFLKEVKAEYEHAFNETLNVWGGKDMPKHTFDKLKEFVRGVPWEPAILKALKKLFSLIGDL